jgi:predicted nucleic acid-binding protein
LVIGFLDASALIYLIEGQEPFARKVRSAMARLVQTDPALAVAVSRLTWLECRVGPMKTNDGAALAGFDAFFAQPDLKWVELSREVVELATVIRVHHGLRTPDALQAASCLQLGDAHLMLTGDAGFRRVAGLKVQLLGGR